MNEAVSISRTMQRKSVMQRKAGAELAGTMNTAGRFSADDARKINEFARVCRVTEGNAARMLVTIRAIKSLPWPTDIETAS